MCPKSGSTVPSLPSGSENTPAAASEWVVAELTSGFGGLVAVCRAPSGDADAPGEVLVTSLVVAPSARQRGVAGALVDFIVSTKPDEATVFTKLPSYKNKVAKKTIVSFFEARGVEIVPNFGG